MARNKNSEYDSKRLLKEHLKRLAGIQLQFCTDVAATFKGIIRALKEKAPAAANPYEINLATFSKRLKTLYAHWNEHKDDLWGASEALSVATPPASDDLRYLKSSALNIWLLGFEFPETIMVFTRKQIHFLCGQKKASLLEVVKSSAKQAVGVDVVMHIKAKTDDGMGLMDAIFRAIYALSKEDVPVVGHIAKEPPEGNLLEAWSNKLKESKIQLTDITSGLSDLFAVKDENEINCIKKAAYLSASVLKDYMVPKLESIIDEEKKVKHSSLMDDAEKVILEPSKINVKLRASNVDICYPPIIQSGGEFDLRPSAASNDENLYYDSGSVIICAVGSRYNSYCTNVARTILIDATSIQIKAYEVLLKAQEAAIGALKPGNKTSDAYQAALLVVEKNAPELLANLTKSAGTGIGLEFRESSLNLNSKNNKVLKENMIFNVSIGFQNLRTEINKPKSQNFSLLLADTVIVKPKPEVVTAKSSKAVKDVAYSFNDGEEEEEEKPKMLLANSAEAMYWVGDPTVSSRWLVVWKARARGGISYGRFGLEAPSFSLRRRPTMKRWL
uniref:FACT complex subunit n=1 Tax=Kalanchoe fedtschenkoi TaxID=63787 RepID=A0A7N0RAU6_KALFE